MSRFLQVTVSRFQSEARLRHHRQKCFLYALRSVALGVEKLTRGGVGCDGAGQEHENLAVSASVPNAIESRLMSLFGTQPPVLHKTKRRLFPHS